MHTVSERFSDCIVHFSEGASHAGLLRTTNTPSCSTIFPLHGVYINLLLVYDVDKSRSGSPSQVNVVQFPTDPSTFLIIPLPSGESVNTTPKRRYNYWMRNVPVYLRVS